MRRTPARGIALLTVVGLLALAGLDPRPFAGTGAQTAQPTPTPVTLPFAADVSLKPGTDSDLVLANCTLCHTLKPIVTHDGFTKEQWAQEVRKMRETYGSPVDEATAARIEAPGAGSSPFLDVSTRIYAKRVRRL